MCGSFSGFKFCPIYLISPYQNASCLDGSPEGREEVTQQQLLKNHEKFQVATLGVNKFLESKINLNLQQPQSVAHLFPIPRLL